MADWIFSDCVRGRGDVPCSSIRGKAAKLAVTLRTARPVSLPDGEEGGDGLSLVPLAWRAECLESDQAAIKLSVQRAAYIYVHRCLQVYLHRRLTAVVWGPLTRAQLT